MKREEEICKRYADELAAIAALDRRYYLNPSPALADRKDYAARQAQLEHTRFRFYAELAAFRQQDLRELRRCRSVIRRSRLQPTPTLRD